MIVQNISHGSGTPATDLSFTVDKPDLLKAQKVIDGLKKEIGFREVIATEKIGKLSIVGVGMKSHTGVAGKMFETLANEGVNIDMISTSEIKISVVIDLAKGEAGDEGRPRGVYRELKSIVFEITGKRLEDFQFDQGDDDAGVNQRDNHVRQQFPARSPAAVFPKTSAARLCAGAQGRARSSASNR